jgi:hypothetical protein
MCMDFSSCPYPFSENEIRRFLEPKGFERFDQLRTDFELRQVIVPVGGSEERVLMVGGS